MIKKEFSRENNSVKNFKVCVIGLGRIGLPFALVAASAGNIVYGIDKNPYIINSLLKRKAPFYEPGLQELIERHLNINFFPLCDMKSITDKCEIIVITINTKFDIENKRIYLSNIYSLFDELMKNNMIKDKTIVMRSTVPIGTTDILKKRIENILGLKEGKDFFLAYCPERMVEGRAIEEIIKLPKIIGSYSLRSFNKIASFFQTIGGPVLHVSEPKVAEFIKLAENSWRQTLFAFSNELALLAEKLGLDVVEVIKT